MAAFTRSERENKRRKEAAPDASVATPAQGAMQLLRALPSDFLIRMFDFLTPAELARTQSVSKNIFTEVNKTMHPAMDEKTPEEEKRIMRFMPGRNAALDAYIDTQPTTSLQRAWLRTGNQYTPLTRQFFLDVRGAILAGRLSAQEVMDQAIALEEWGSDAFETSDLCLAQIGSALEEDLFLPWQRAALNCGFTWSDVLSDWISRQHIVQIMIHHMHPELPPYSALPPSGSALPPYSILPSYPELPIDGLRGLKIDQLEGLRLGLTMEEVQSHPHLSSIHTEAAHFYNRPIRDLLHLSWTEVLYGVVHPLLRGNGLDALHEMTKEKWRSSCVEGFSHMKTPLFEVMGHSPALFAGMLKVCEYTPAEWVTLMTKPEEYGFDAGVLPLFDIVYHGDIRTFLAIQSHMSEEEWATAIMRTASSFGSITPLYIAVGQHQDRFGPRVDLLALIWPYSPIPFRKLIVTPLTSSGPYKGRTPLYRALAADSVDNALMRLQRLIDDPTCAYSAAFHTMRKLCKFENEAEWIHFVREHIQALQATMKAKSEEDAKNTPGQASSSFSSTSSQRFLVPSSHSAAASEYASESTDEEPDVDSDAYSDAAARSLPT